jgi:ribosomal protein L7Ae-like RNA K-turn-binding protein
LMNDNKNKFHNFIGLARRAGKVVLGSEAIEDAIRSKKALLVIVAADAAKGTAKRLMDKCKSYNVPCMVFGTKQSLGKITGVGEAAGVAVTHSSFANELIRMSEEFYGGGINHEG